VVEGSKAGIGFPTVFLLLGERAADALARPAAEGVYVARIGLNALALYTGATFRNAGVSRYTTRLIEALLHEPAAHEYRIFLNPRAERLPFEDAPHARFARTRWPTHRTPIRIAWEQLMAPAQVAAARLDLTHSFLNVAPLLAPGRHVVTVHDLSFVHVPEAHPRHRRWYLSLATRLSVGRAAAVLADSQATKDDVVRLFGADPARITVVYPGVEPDFHPRSGAALEAFRATHRLPARFVLFVGTLEPRKNVDVLVRAFAQLRHAGAYAGELVIVGGRGWGPLRLEALARELGVAEHVRLVGYVRRAELPLWYTAAELMVYPSSYEGFGIPLLEAMASGTPVVASNRSSLPEVVGDAGITVDPRAVPRLASVMAEALASTDRRDAMRARGLARAQRFQWTAAAHACLSVYQRVLNRR